MFLIEITTLFAMKMVLLAIGEPVELFAFGAGLVVTVGVIRWFFGRDSAADETEDKEGLTNN
jgi:hypothetical protein